MPYNPYMPHNQIVTVKAQPSNHRYGNMEMLVVTNDGHETVAFPWFDDELTFTTEEIIGLTVEEARDLKQKRDVAYLQS